MRRTPYASKSRSYQNRGIRCIAVALCIAATSLPAAATQWKLATTTGVKSGMSARSAMTIDATVVLPNSCYLAQIVKASDGSYNYNVEESLLDAGSCKPSSRQSITCSVAQPFVFTGPSGTVLNIKGRNKARHTHVWRVPVQKTYSKSKTNACRLK